MKNKAVHKKTSQNMDLKKKNILKTFYIIKRLLNDLFTFTIKCTSRLIKNQYFWIS